MNFQKKLLFSFSGLFLVSSPLFGDDIPLDSPVELLEENQEQSVKNNESLNTFVHVGASENSEICLFPIKSNKTRVLKNHLRLKKKGSYKEDSTKVLLLRNPWDRAFAMYKKFLKQEEKKESVSENVSEVYANRHDVSKSFLLYLSEINKGLHKTEDIFQHTTLEKFAVSLNEIDHIFFMDSLNSDLRNFCREEKLAYSPITILKKTTCNGITVTQFVNSNAKIKHLLNSIWEKDIELF